MNITVRKIGNSEGIILPKEMLGRLKLRAGDKVTICRNGDGVAVTRRQGGFEPASWTWPQGHGRNHKDALRELAK